MTQFTYTIGGVAPAPQPIQISNSGGGTLAWAATTSASWLTVTPASGMAPSVLSLGVSPAGLIPGPYTGTVQISATGASNSPISITIKLTVAAQAPKIGLTSSSLQFAYTIGGTVPAAQAVQITNSGGGTLAWSASTSAPWLTITPASGTAPSTLYLGISTTGLVAGPYTGTVQISATSASNSPVSISVSLAVNSAAPVGPQIAAVGGVVNGATFQSGGIAPNEFISIGGSGLGPAAAAGSSTPKKTLGGTSIYIGGTAAYLVYAQNGLVNALVPFEVAGAQSTTIQGEFNGVMGNTVTVPVVNASPGLFTQGYGPGQVWLVNQDGTFNAASNPASRNTYIAFWATGQGLVNVTLPDGTQPSGPTYPLPLLPVSVSIGGVQLPAANVVFDNLIFTGEIQVNVLIPENVPTGGAVPLVLSIGGSSSRADATIAIQ